MSTLHTDISQFINQIQKPSDGDERDAQSFNVGFEGLADRTRYLKDQGFYSALSFGGTGLTPYANVGFYHISSGILLRPGVNIGFWNSAFNSVRTYTRTCNAGASHISDSTEYRVELGYQFVQDAINVTRTFITWEVDVPDAATLTGIAITIDPATSASHAADLTGLIRPQAELVQINNINGTPTTLTTAIDIQTTKSGYEAQHVLLNTCGVVVDKSLYSYIIRFVGEGAGAGNATGMRIQSPNFGFSRAKLGEE